MVYLHEIAHAIRRLRRTTAFTSITVIILALGIASNTLIFSVINATLLRPLPYRNPEQIIVFNWHFSGMSTSTLVSASTFFLLQKRARSFASFGAVTYSGIGVNLSSVGKPQSVSGARISGDFFRTLDIVPLLGRGFSSEEEQPGGSRVVILSHDLWTRYFDKDPAALGETIRVDGEAFTVVGVMPEHFRAYPEADLWLPLQISPTTVDSGNSGNVYLVIGRLREGVKQEDAQRELDGSPEYRLTYPLSSAADQVRLTLNGLKSWMVSYVRPALTLLWGAVLFVLLITCTNLAVLLTVRAAGCVREIAIRLALGASRACVIRMFLIESLIVALLGGISGIVLAKEAIPFALLLAPTDNWFNPSVSIDGAVILFTALISVLTALAFGLSPALRMSRANLNELLRQTTSNATCGSQHARLSSILVSAQTALTILLLIGAGLLLRSFAKLHSVPPGFDSPHLWAVQLSLTSQRYKTTSSTAQFLEPLCRKIVSQPGVEAASSILGIPLDDQLKLNMVVYPSDRPEKAGSTLYRIIGPEYFRAMGIRLLAGRQFSSSDRRQATPVAIVNETLARQWWPKESSLGRYVAFSIKGGIVSDFPRQIVGVVTDVHESGLSKPSPPAIFVPMSQVPDSIAAFANRVFPTSIIVRTANDISPEGYLRDLVNSVDPDLPVTSVRPFSEIISSSLSRQRFYTYLIAGFGVFALLLTAVGLYALLSYQVVLRTREIGLRIAVGAKRSEVVGMIVKRGIGLVLLGTVIGMAAVPLETKILASMLYNVQSIMPMALVGAVVVLAAVAALASLLSAVRAASIEPAVALNSE